MHNDFAEQHNVLCFIAETLRHSTSLTTARPPSRPTTTGPHGTVRTFDVALELHACLHASASGDGAIILMSGYQSLRRRRYALQGRLHLRLQHRRLVCKHFCFGFPCNRTSCRKWSLFCMPQCCEM